MPLSSDDFVQKNWGTADPGGTTSLVIPLTGGNNPDGVGTTAGNTVLIFLTADGSGVGAPSGWVNDKSHTGALYAFRGSDIPADQTSWTCAVTASSDPYRFYVVELSNVDLVEPLDASAASSTGMNIADGGTLSTQTTPLNAGLNTVVFAVFGADASVGSTWSGYTGDFEEVQEVAPGGINYHLAVACKFVTGTTGQFETTATLDTSGSNSPSTQAIIVAYRAADSPIVAPLAMLTGFEGGTHGGITATTGANALMGNAHAHVGTWGTHYLIQGSSARTGSYGLRIVRPGTAGNVKVGALSAKGACAGLSIRIVSATGTVNVAGLANAAGTTMASIVYDSTTNKFGLAGGSATSWQDGTTALDTWVWIDFRVSCSSSTRRLNWRIETAPDTYTEQAAATLTGAAVDTMTQLILGGSNTSTQTVTAEYDDVVLSSHYVAYPLGPHEVRLLTPAGTATVVGTSISQFTANGTLAAIDAATAASLVDEVPPTVSASADGVCQTATAASDYIEFPMAAPTLAADEIISGVRMLAAMWGGTGAGTGTVGIRSWDGTTETTMIPASTSYDAGSPTAVSTTEPRWECAMWPAPNGWTKTKLDAAALRFGFSTDAAPDMGTDAMYLEYATRKAQVQPLFGTMATQSANPNTLGIRSVTVDTNVESGKAADLVYEESGSPTTVPVAADTSQTETIDAPDAPTVNYIALYPDPES